MPVVRPSMGAGRAALLPERRENECQLADSDKIVVELVAINANLAEMMVTCVDASMCAA